MNETQQYDTTSMLYEKNGEVIDRYFVRPKWFPIRPKVVHYNRKLFWTQTF